MKELDAMRRGYTRLISFILAVAMVIGLMPGMRLPTFAAEAETGPVPLYQTIAVQPGQLVPDTCEVVENEIYGCVVGYELKKGHTLSISDTNYVFSVRQLVDGNYSTLLKQATTASFTAAEDMTVGMLIRKPDKSALTAEELASIAIYDSQYGMIGVDGYAHRFTVEAETIDGGTATTRAAIFLPDSYSQSGTPTRLVIMTNGYHGHLTDSIWNANTADDIAVMKHYVDADYAVLVVDNTAQQTSATADLGCPQLVDSYWKAYAYAQANLNVEEMFSIHSRSMGTFAAMRIMREHPELVKCAIMCGPITSIYSRFSVSPAFFANRFGFEDSTGATYEADKVVGYDPYTDVDGVEYALPPTFWMMAESDAVSATLTTIDKIEAHGNDVTAATYTDTDHSGVCRLNTEQCWADALAFLEGHQASDAEHRYCAWTVTRAVTCGASGEIRRECADCDHYETMAVPAAGHNFVGGSDCAVCGHILQDELAQTLTLTRGHFSDSTGAWVDSDIYGCVIGYELKKGHTLSISNADYVFAVRQLVDGNYNTMVKSATTDSFTATEDMTVAIRVRKPDQSALTDEELASIVLYDSFCETASAVEPLSGKTISILGDSISTYTGVSNNTAYNSTLSGGAIYYSPGTLGVYQADTWWQQAIDVLGMELLVNNSWSGSCILNTRSGTVGAYIDRCVQLHNNEGEEPDIIAVFLGTNDFSYYQTTLGTADIDYDALITDNGDGTFAYTAPTTSCEAYAIMLHKMQSRYPNAEIYCMNLLARRDPVYSGTDVGQPTQFNAELAQVIERFGATLVDLENCGITSNPANFDLYMGDKRVHPNAAGMDKMTQAMVSALLGEETAVYNITTNLAGVTSDNSAHAVLSGSTYTAALTLAEGYKDMTVTVTMGGTDVTASCYADGKITVSSATGDIVINASATIDKTPESYRWEFDGTDLVSVGENENALTLTAGTIENGILNSVRYSLAEPVVLYHDREWVLEWKCTGDWNGMLLTSVAQSGTQGMHFLFRTYSASGLLAFGEYSGSQYNNYGIATANLDMTVAHTYRLENRIAADGSNMACLYVDGVELGAMDNYYIGGNSNQNKTVSWVSGRDFVFNYLGSNSHPLTDMELDYIQVWEDGTDTHLHTYVPTVTAPTCTEQGYTTHTCACGDSYVDTYVEATGHSYSGTTCTRCGAVHPEAGDYAGKVISILGDSISTFAGYIPVEDGFNLTHRARYPQDNLLTDVNETWWMQVLTDLDAKLGINDSWAGSRVINTMTGNSGDQGENAAMASLTRIQNLGANGTPDVILFYGGTNDIGYLMTLGSFDPAAAPTEADLTSTKWSSVADAYVAAILRMQYYYPDAEIIALLPTYTTSYYTNAELEQYNAVFAAICEHYGVTNIALRYCGISTADLPDGIHPDATGMDYITDAVLGTLLESCEMEAGENVVYSVTHELDGAEASLGYYKGVSAGKSFVETISGDNLIVTVTMGGVDITASVYADGVVSIPNVTGDLVITAKGKVKPIYSDYLQQLPEDICAGANLWTVLEHNEEYYTVNGWGVHSSGEVYSVTVPINPGDQLWATSFQASGTNGGTGNGIRITWFDEYDVLKSMSPSETYAEFSTNGYLTAPEGAVAVNVVMWNGDESNEFYILTLPHDYESTITAPTCTEQGYTTHTCACGDSYVDSYVNATGHSFGDWYTVTEATCTADGQQRRDCANCDASETQVIAAKGHSYTSVVTKPTCTEQGYTTHTCACGDSYADSYVDATGHSFGEWTVTKAATCTEAGQQRRDCANCDHYETQVIAATGHSYKSAVTKPTCTEQGYTTHTCACGDSYVDSYVDATGHTYGNWYTVTEATCTTDGQERRECANCDASETQVIAAKGHSYTSAVTKPTCTEQGYTTHTCACGDSYVDSYVNATGHTYGDWYTVTEATCTADGQERRDCANCDHYEIQVIAATGHSYKSAVTKPTCTEQGYTTHTCACGDSYVDSYIPALGHVYSYVLTAAPSAGETGTLTGTCSRCQHTDAVALPAISEENYSCEVTKEPTATEPGTAVYTWKVTDYGTVTVEVTLEPLTLLGDVDGNGEIDILDANLTVAYYNEITELTEEQLLAADVNGNGVVDIMDANMIVAYYNEIIDAFPAK